MKTALKKLIPATVKFRLKQYRYAVEDVLDRLTGRSEDLMPPKRLNFQVGGGSFREIGNEFFRYFVDFGGLRPEHRVLDVGSGVGRMAVPLTSYLNSQGGYEGFDIEPDGIRWCTEAVTPRFPNFRFQVADIHNSFYNPAGRYKASEYRFPYEDGTFDFVFLTSVFTHLLPDEVENYTAEISRVLRPGGRCLITFFLLNPESLRAIEEGKNTDFVRDFGVYRSSNVKALESAVAFKEEYVRDLYARHGLEILEPIRYGSWCKRPRFTSYQDIVVAQKKAV